MKIDEIRKQFSIYIVDPDINIGSLLKTQLMQNGFQVSSFSAPLIALSEIRRNLPHIVLTNIQMESGCINPLIEQIKSISSEMLIIGLQESRNVDKKNLPIFDICYDFILKPIFHEQEIVTTVDKAIEKLYYQFENEQLYETLHKTGWNKHEAQIFYEKWKLDELGFSQLKTLNEKMLSFKTHDSLLEFALSFFYEITQKPIIFLKYLPAYESLLVYRAQGRKFDEIRGLGLKLDGYNFEEQERLLNHPNDMKDLKELLHQGLKIQKYLIRTLKEENEIFGFFIFEMIDESFGPKIDAFIQNFNLAYRIVTLQKQIHDVNKIDPLTHCYHRKAFMDAVEFEISRARRIGSPLGLISLELDNLSELIEQKGMKYVNELLKVISTILIETSRSTDIIGKISDNQFSMLLPHTHKEGTALKAEKIRKIISATKLPHLREAHLGLTLNFGISEYPTLASDATTLFRATEEALDQVKKKGGNQRICQSTPPFDYKPDFLVDAQA